MTKWIPVFKPYLGVDTVKAVTDALDIGWLGMGSFVKEFEESLAEYLGLQDRYLVAVNTCTSALHLSVILAGVGPGDEVIVPSFNNIGDFQAIHAVGAEPVFCDIHEDDLGIDCSKAEELISPRTKAMIPLHYAGPACRLDDVYALASRYQLRVIEDAAHALGTRYKGRMIGSFGDLTCFSFDPIKIITCIDGGAVVVNSPEDVERLHALRLLGMTQASERLYSNQKAWTYDVVSEGYRYHLANCHASIGLSQLSKLDEFIANRQRYCRLYNELLSDIEEIKTPPTNFERVGPFLYYIRVLNGRRAELREYCRSKGVDTGFHWTPGHRFSFFRDCRAGDLTVTETIAEQVVDLPLHSYMDEQTIGRVVDAVASFFKKRPS